jgi:uncharacterized membrane protein YfcA
VDHPITERNTVKPNVKRIATFVTGALALALVAASAGSALTYAYMHQSETLNNLGNSTLSGVGMAIGGCLGSALVLRFKAARRFVQNFVHEVSQKPLPFKKEP